MIDTLIPSIEQISAEGAVLLAKWDGERKDKKCTVLISRQDTDYFWRQDTDDMFRALQAAIADYRSHHPQPR